MASIDPSIALQVKGVQLQDPLEAMGKITNLRQLAGQQQLQQMQIQQAEREQGEQRTLADLYKGNVNPDGTINRQGILQGAAQRGLGGKVPVLQKSFADADKSTADVAETKSKTAKQEWELNKSRIDARSNALQSLVQDPQLSHDRVISTLSGMVQNNIITAEQGQEAVKALPGDINSLRDHLYQQGLATLDAAKRFELTAPKFEKVDNGGKITLGTVDPRTGQFSGKQDVKKVASPDAVLSSNTSMANARMTDARERTLSQQGVTYETDINGNLLALPTKRAPGASVTSTPVLDANGKPTMGKQAAGTEDQSKAAGWLVQADNAWRNMQSALEADSSASKPGMADAVANIPLVGKAAGNAMRSPERQKFVQGASSLSESVLRAATGAGVNKDEALQKVEELTPVWGEDEETTKQKMAAIPLYIESLKVRAGTPGRKVMAAADAVREAEAAGGAPKSSIKPGTVDTHGGQRYRFKGGDPKVEANWEKMS